MKELDLEYKGYKIKLTREEEKSPFDKSKYAEIEIFSHKLENWTGSLEFRSKEESIDSLIYELAQSRHEVLNCAPIFGDETEFSLDYERHNLVGFIRFPEKVNKAPLLLEDFIEELNLWLNHAFFYITIYDATETELFSSITTHQYNDAIKEAHDYIDIL